MTDNSQNIEDDWLDKIFNNFDSNFNYAKSKTDGLIHIWIRNSDTKVAEVSPQVFRFIKFYISKHYTLNSEVEDKIGFLRQALNEDRITDPKKMVDNEYIKHWLQLQSNLKRSKTELGIQIDNRVTPRTIEIVDYTFTYQEIIDFLNDEFGENGELNNLTLENCLVTNIPEGVEVFTYEGDINADIPLVRVRYFFGHRLVENNKITDNTFKNEIETKTHRVIQGK